MRQFLLDLVEFFENMTETCKGAIAIILLLLLCITVIVLIVLLWKILLPLSIVGTILYFVIFDPKHRQW